MAEEQGDPGRELLRKMYKLNLTDSITVEKMCMVRMAEIMIEQVVAQLPADLSGLHLMDELYVRAYIRQLFQMMKAMADEIPPFIPIPPKNTEEYEAHIEMIANEHPFVRKCLTNPSANLKANIAARLESAKRRAADRFVDDFRSIVDTKEITSPIEQLFLMEWKLMGVESKHDVILDPQALLESPIGTFQLDFIVRSKSDGSSRMRIGIEIDGHDFHEKTKEQATKDKRRERAIVASGVRILRFTGSEVFNHTRKCVQEVIAILNSDQG